MRSDGIAAPSRRAGSGRRVWTFEAVRALGTVTDVHTAGQILGMGRTKACQLVRSQSFPVRILKIDRCCVVPVQGAAAGNRLKVEGLLGLSGCGANGCHQRACRDEAPQQQAW
jgi:hypothetical protein